MRERIASVIHETEFNTPGGNVSFELQVADAILAALPSMVKPLEWDKNPDEQAWYCVLTGGDGHDRGYMVLPTRKGFELFDGFGYYRVSIGFYKTEAKAKGAADKRNVSQAMAAFGIEVKA